MMPQWVRVFPYRAEKGQARVLGRQRCVAEAGVRLWHPSYTALSQPINSSSLGFSKLVAISQLAIVQRLTVPT